jgi:hypothetical protein
VTFYNGATSLGTGTLSGGVATLSTTSLPAGALTLQVSYAGAGNFLPTNSAPFDQTVNQVPSLTTPTPGSTLTGSTVTFSWSPGSGTAGYQLWIGTTGAGSSNIYNSGGIFATSAAVTNLPINGGAVYARLYSKINNAWVFTDYTYTAF